MHCVPKCTLEPVLPELTIGFHAAMVGSMALRRLIMAFNPRVTPRFCPDFQICPPRWPRSTVKEPKYKRVQPAAPKLGQFEEPLTKWLEEEAKLARPRHRTAHRLFEGLQEIGYSGAYDSVQRFVKRWKSAKHSPKLTGAFVPLHFQPSDTCQSLPV